jgi:rSAM/selenodomain-associated transferase 1
MSLSQTAVVIMSKYPEAGKVKTRLTPALSPQQAADVHSVFLSHWLQRLVAMKPKELTLCFDPPNRQADFARLIEPIGAMRLLPQASGDLGARLTAAADDAFARHAGALFFGVDSPTLPAPWLDNAAANLRRFDVVLGPTTDGGYWTIGLTRRVDPVRLFTDIEWSSGRERAQTESRARSLGYGVCTMESNTWVDVDQPHDLEQLLHRLEQTDIPEHRPLLSALSFVPRRG